MYKKILVGIDGSEHSMKAIDKAIEIQKRDQSKLIVFHSVLHHITEVRPVLSGAVDIGSNISYEIHQDTVKKANKFINEIKERFRTEGIDGETKLIYDLGPQYYIKNQVKEESIDLVVLGCEGEHGKLKRTLLGTVPEYVINNVDTDVLIVK
jgi:nucleotide-binding universal stress UspA family protein